MRSIFKLSLLAASMALVAGCGDKAENNTQAKAETKAEMKTAAAKTDSAKTDTDMADNGGYTSDTDKFSYGLGVSLGKYMKKSLDQNKSVDVNLDNGLILKGFKEALDETSTMDDKAVEEAMKGLDALVRGRHEERNKQLAEEAKKEGETFLAEHAKKEGVKVTESGLQYQVVKQGDGAKPAATDRVKVHYKGTLINGEKFDSSYDRDQPAVFGVSQVIKGWTEGLQLMPVGSKYNFAIPSELAYGERGNGKITPHATLLFEVELLSIEKTETE